MMNTKNVVVCRGFWIPNSWSIPLEITTFGLTFGSVSGSAMEVGDGMIDIEGLQMAEIGCKRLACYCMHLYRLKTIRE